MAAVLDLQADADTIGADLAAIHMNAAIEALGSAGTRPPGTDLSALRPINRKSDGAAPQV